MSTCIVLFALLFHVVSGAEDVTTSWPEGCNVTELDEQAWNVLSSLTPPHLPLNEENLTSFYSLLEAQSSHTTEMVGHCSSRPEVLERMSNFSFSMQVPNLLSQNDVNHTELIIVLDCFESIGDLGQQVYQNLVILSEKANSILPTDMAVAGYCVSLFYAFEEVHNLVNVHCRNDTYHVKNEVHQFITHHYDNHLSHLCGTEQLTYNEARVVLASYAPEFDAIVHPEDTNSSVVTRPDHKTEIVPLLEIFTKVENITTTLIN